MVAHSEGTLDLAVRIVGLGDDFLYSVGIKEARNVVKLSIVCGKVEGLVSAVGKVVWQTAHLWHTSGLHAVPVKECRVRKEGRIYSVVGVNAGGVSIFIAERQGKKFIKAWGEGALGIEVSAMLCRHSLHDNHNDTNNGYANLQVYKEFIRNHSEYGPEMFPMMERLKSEFENGWFVPSVNEAKYYMDLCNKRILYKGNNPKFKGNKHK